MLSREESVDGEMEKRKMEDGKERELMGGRFIRTEADKERKERRKNSVGGGGESLIWRGKRARGNRNCNCDKRRAVRPTIL